MACGNILVEGITGNVDLNYSIYDYKNIIKKANLNHLNNNTNSIYHVVVKGDTLTLLAKKYNVNVELIEWPREARLTESGSTVFDSSKLDEITGLKYSHKFKDWIS